MFNLFKRKKKTITNSETLELQDDIKTEIVSPDSINSSRLEDENLPNFNNLNNIIGGIYWYQKNYYLAMKITVFLAVSLCVSIGFIIVLILTKPSPVYFAATSDLRIAKLVPLTEPVMTEQALLNWSSDIVTSAVSLDFLEWRKKLQDIRPNFSESAFESFVGSLKTSGILDLVRNKRLNVSAVLTQAPVITKTGVLNGSMSWQIEFPLILSYESSAGVETTQKLVAQILVSRASTITTPRGIAIQQIVLRR